MNKIVNKITLCFLVVLLSSAFTACLTGGPQPKTIPKTPDVTFPLAIRMAEARIIRFVTTPQQMRDRTWEISKNDWDSVELISQRELSDGSIEYTLKFSVNQGTRIYTTEQKNTIRGPKNTIVSSFGPLGGPNEDLSAYNAQILINKCKDWYLNDPDYRKITDILEKEIVTKLKYDWDHFYGKQRHTYEQAVSLGLGICDVYAQRVKEVLTEAGYTVEKWSSSIGNHAWNQVVLPNGKILYIDATWYDNTYENHPTQQSPDGYEPWYITYDKPLFEHGFLGKINMHGGWPDAKKNEY